MRNAPLLPFEVSFAELKKNIDDFVEPVFRALESDFLVLPKGRGFVSFDVFATGYEAICKATDNFREIDPDRLFRAVREKPISLVVLRTILGLSPPEWADVATTGAEEPVSQGFVRSLDRKIRRGPDKEVGHTPVQEQRIRALLRAACRMLAHAVPDVGREKIHRLDKIDTAQGRIGLERVAAGGVTYPALLYERFLGRPFAAHRDSVSEIIGGVLEDEIERRLVAEAIDFRRTTRAEPVEGWDQNPDFFCPDHVAPVVVIEAKLTQDDGTARDKVARVLRLAQIRDEMAGRGKPPFQLIACIGGRGFGVRRADMKALLLATQGNVFALSQLDYFVECTKLKQLRGKSTARQAAATAPPRLGGPPR